MRLAMLAAACVVAVAMFAVLRWLPARGHDEVTEPAEPADPVLGTVTTGSG